MSRRRTHSAEYRAHLASPKWRAIRKAALARAGYRCQLCNTTSRLEVHHRTYVNLGNERPEDLTVLCSTCHDLADNQRRARTRPARKRRNKRRRGLGLRTAVLAWGGLFVIIGLAGDLLPK